MRGVLGFLSHKTNAGVLFDFFFSLLSTQLIDLLGVDFAVQMVIVALSIAVGVFVGQLVEIPKWCNKKLKKVNVAL